MKRLSRDRFTTVLDPRLPPAITIRSGEELIVETWDAYKGIWDAREEPRVVAPATGLIAVEDAHPGDVLRVDVLGIQPGSTAMHDVRPGRGFLGDRFTERHLVVMAIDGHSVHFPGGLRIPLNPCLVLIATTPPEIRQTAT